MLNDKFTNFFIMFINKFINFFIIFNNKFLKNANYLKKRTFAFFCDEHTTKETKIKMNVRYRNAFLREAGA